MLAGLALAAATLQAPAPSEQDIIIRGVRPSEHQLRDFVRALTDVPSFAQIGRFHSRVCPVAIGLAEVQNARIVERMRQVATAAKIPLAPTKCTPNSFLIVAPDKTAAIRELNRRFPIYFSAMSDREIRKLADAPEPAAAWQVMGLLTADGLEAAKSVGSDSYTVRAANTPSRIKAASKPTFKASVLVIDIKSAAGLTVTQLADYAAMRTFANLDPTRLAKVGVPSILAVLGAPDDKPLPVTLTYWDLGFLKSLYATDNSYLASYQRGDMERIVKKETAQAGAADRRR
jgi:hypothetical protein